MVAPKKQLPKLSSVGNGTAVAAIKRKVQQDGWINILTGIGTQRDKITYSEVDWRKTTRQTADGLYASDDLGGKIASIIPFDGVRAGISWDIEDAKTNPDIITFLDDEFTRLDVWGKLYLGWVWGRVYGGALAVLSIDDGQQLDQPVDPNRIQSINAINVFDRWQWEIQQEFLITNPASPYYGEPEWYVYVGDNLYSGQERRGNVITNYFRVHRSRVIRFDGSHLADRLWKINQFWHDSIYGKLWEPLRNYSMVHNSLASMLQELNQPVFKIEGLTEALQQDQDELIMRKLQQVNLSRSVARAVAIDAMDSFDNVSVATSGVDTLVQKCIDRLTAASNIPHTRLMGESPAGLGGSGRSELTDYYDFVGAQQKVYLSKPITYLTKLFFAQKTAKVKEPAKWAFKFNPLQLPTEKEKKETEEIQARIDEIYIRSGVIGTTEVANSRYGSGTYSFETHLDDDRDDTEVEPMELSNGEDQPTE